MALKSLLSESDYVAYIQAEDSLRKDAALAGALEFVCRLLESLRTENMQSESEEKLTLIRLIVSRTIQIVTKRTNLDYANAKLVAVYLDNLANYLMTFASSNRHDILDLLVKVFAAESPFYKAATSTAPSSGEHDSKLTAFPERGFLDTIIASFIDKGHIDHLIALLEDEKNTFSLSTIRVFMVLFTLLKERFPTTQRTKIATCIQDKLLSRILEMPNANMKHEDKIVFVDLYSSFESFFVYINPFQAGEMADCFQFKVALKLFSSPFLEKRLMGLSDIRDLLETTERREDWSSRPVPFERELAQQRIYYLSRIRKSIAVQLLLENKFLEQLFGQSKHTELLKRSSDILIFFLRGRLLTEEHFKMIWDATLGSHESTKAVILKTLNEILSFMNESQLDFLLKTAMSGPIESMDLPTIQFIRTLTWKSADKKFDQHRIFEEPAFQTHDGVMFLWEISQETSAVPHEIRFGAINGLLEILNTYCFEADRIKIMKMCFSNIVDDQSVGVSLKMLRFLLNEVYAECQKRRMPLEFLQIIKEIKPEATSHLSALCLDCKRYKSRVIDAMKERNSKPLDVPLIDTCFQSRISHRERITTILDIIGTLVTKAGITLSESDADEIWDAFVLNSVCTEERDLAYAWFLHALKEAADSELNSFPVQTATHVFDAKICCTPLEHMTLAGFELFHFYFKEINSGLHQERVGENIDSNIRGLPMLWRIATECEHEDVGIRAIENLNREYKATAIVRDGRSLWIERFLNISMGMLRQSIQSIDDASSNVDTSRERRIVHRILHLLTVQLRTYDLNYMHVYGAVTRKRHGATERGQLISITIKATVMQKSFQLKCFTEDTLGATRKKVASELSTTPAQIRMFAGGRELKSDTKTLKAEGISDNHVIPVIIRQNLVAGQEPSIDAAEPSDSAISPSAILSLPENFSAFMHILGYGDQLSEKVWDILMLLPTATEMLVLLENLGHTIDWQSIFDQHSIYKFFYNLQIVDMLIQSSQSAEWASRFAACGGVDALLAIISSVNFFSTPEGKHVPCLLLAMKILNNFLLDIPYELSISAQFLELQSLDHLEVKRSSDAISLQDPVLLFRNILPVVCSAAKHVGPDVENAIGTKLTTSEYEIFVRALLSIFPYVVSSGTDISSFLLQDSFDFFVDSTLMKSRSTSVREFASGYISRLCSHSKEGSQSNTKMLVIQKLGSLLAESQNYAENVSQYFDLFTILVREVLADSSLQESSAILAPIQQSAIQLLLDHETYEKRHESTEDFVLIGLLKLLKELVCESSHRALALDENMQRKLIDYLANDCLFSYPTVEHNDVLAPPKCKSRNARRQAYHLLGALASLSSETFLVVCNIMQDRKAEGSKYLQWNYQPSSLQKSSSGYVGLKNQGATCYMNSLIQQLYMVPGFRYEILSAPCTYDEPSDMGSTLSSPSETPQESTLHFLKVMFSNLLDSEKKFYDTIPFCRTYRDSAGEPVNTAVQMDVVEFFNSLFDCLENQLKGKPQESILKEHFGGNLLNQIISKECEHVSERKESFFLLSVDVNGKSTINESLESFVQGEMLEGDNKYHCERCDKKVDALKRCCLDELPNTLVVHLKRFDFDFELMRRMKLNTYCEFPMELDMQPYTKEGIAEKENKASPNPVSSDELPLLKESSYYKYQLAGVLVHMGTADSGHYYSYIKSRTTGAQNKWYIFNDSLVEEIDPKDLPHLCYGGNETTNGYDNYNRPITKQQSKSYSGYILFYERADQRSNETDPALQPRNVIPAPIYEHIWSENTAFMKDLALFDEDHFDFMWKLSQCPQLQLLDPQVKYSVFEILFNFFVDVFAHAKEKPHLIDWVEWFNAKAAINPPLASWVLDRSVAEDLALSLLISCTHAETRAAFANILVCCLKLVCSTTKAHNSSEQSCPSLDSALTLVRKLADRIPELHKMQRVFSQYFGVLKDFANLGAQQVHFLISCDIIPKLLILLTEVDKQQTAAEIKRKKAKYFEKLAPLDLSTVGELLSILLRSIAVSEKSLLSPHRFCASLINPSEAKFDRPTAAMLVHFLRESSCVEPISNLLMYYCWEDFSITIETITHLTKKERLVDSEDKWGFFYTLSQLATLQDSLFEKRNQKIANSIVHLLSGTHPRSISEKLIDQVNYLADSSYIIKSIMFHELDRYLLSCLCNPSDLVRQSFCKFLEGLRSLSIPEGGPTADMVGDGVYSKSIGIIAAVYQLMDEDEKDLDESFDAEDKFADYFTILSKTFRGTEAQVSDFIHIAPTAAKITNHLLTPSQDVTESDLSWISFLRRVFDESPESIRVVYEHAEFTKGILSAYWNLNPANKKSWVVSDYLCKLYGIVLDACKKSDTFCKTACEHSFFDFMVNILLFKREDYPEVVAAVFRLIDYWCQHETIGQIYRKHAYKEQFGKDPKSIPVARSSVVLRYMSTLLCNRQEMERFVASRDLSTFFMLVDQLAAGAGRDHPVFFENFGEFAVSLLSSFDESTPSQRQYKYAKSLLFLSTRLFTKHPLTEKAFQSLFEATKLGLQIDSNLEFDFLQRWALIEEDRQLGACERNSESKDYHMQPNFSELWKTSQISLEIPMIEVVILDSESSLSAKMQLYELVVDNLCRYFDSQDDDMSREFRLAMLLLLSTSFSGVVLKNLVAYIADADHLSSYFDDGASLIIATVICRYVELPLDQQIPSDILTGLCESIMENETFVKQLSSGLAASVRDVYLQTQDEEDRPLSSELSLRFKHILTFIAEIDENVQRCIINACFDDLSLLATFGADAWADEDGVGAGIDGLISSILAEFYNESDE
eukprot:TRINITY_DN301_c0_g1_i4.p1 TRINITY_DN301_c0_g1~~TRINITY_DN301_c0_g1_i4.p1  ORF type:complete len:2791 (-),score=522.89 TRINITY_DN301_c0_g1_i4:451-8823(-)